MTKKYIHSIVTQWRAPAMAMAAALTVQLQAQQNPGQAAAPRPVESGQIAPDAPPSKPGQSGLDKYRHGDKSAFVESTFLTEVAQHNQMEIKLGQLASQKSQNQEVKQFANHVVQDHTKLGDELKKLSAKQTVNLPASVDAKHQAMLDKFESSSGAEFDKEFAKHMVKGHAKAVTKFQKASTEAQDMDIRNFATETLPKLKEHLVKAQELARSLGVDASTIVSLMSEIPDVGAPAIGVERDTGVGEKKYDTEKAIEPPTEKIDRLDDNVNPKPEK